MIIKLLNNSKRKTYQLRMSDFDMALNIKPSAILDLFQDVACLHADEIGTGFDDMYKKGMLWVLTKIKFTVHQMPKLYQNVTVQTHIVPNDKIEFARDFVIFDENGEKLISATSRWAVIGKETRKIILNPPIYPEDFIYADKTFVGELKKIPAFDGEKSTKIIESQYNELDRNGHVNNIFYANYAINAVNFNSTIKQFQIDFRKEVLLGDKIAFETKISGNDYFVAGKREDTTLFLCKIEKGK